MQQRSYAQGWCPGRLDIAVVRGEDDIVVVKFWSVRSMRESVWRDASLISLSEGMIV